VASENEKVEFGIVLHIDSYDLHGNRFFDENELESLFYLDHLLFLSRVMAVFFPVSSVGGPLFDMCRPFHP
jgi:hypothetical protein